MFNEPTSGTKIYKQGVLRLQAWIIKNADTFSAPYHPTQHVEISIKSLHKLSSKNTMFDARSVNQCWFLFDSWRGFSSATVQRSQCLENKCFKAGMKANYLLDKKEIEALTKNV